MIIAELIELCREKLSHLEDGSLDVALIFTEVLKLSRVQLITGSEQELSEEQISKIEDLIERRAKFEPLAYIQNAKNFMGLRLYVDKNVLIPRSETELLCEKIINHMAKKTMKGIEFGVGSGAIAIALLYANSNLQMDAVDISKAALEIAKKNALYNLVAQRLCLFEFDILRCRDYEQLKPNSYDFIVSNPPYISSSSMGELMPDVLRYEPRLALDGGDDGLTFYRCIAMHASSLLKSTGFIAFEIGYDQGDAMREILKQNNFKQIEIIKDYESNDRIAFAIK